MQFYMAGSWVVRDFVKKRALELGSMGHLCLSTWINEDTTKYSDKINAMIDASEVLAADHVVVILDIGAITPGKHVELGIAIAANKPVHLIGRGMGPCVFYAHPLCRHYEMWEDFAAYVKARW